MIAVVKKNEIKRHLVETTIELLNEVYDVDELTVRKIAAEAYVATGLINYYYDSKEDLVIEAIDKLIAESTKSKNNRLYDLRLSPRERLRFFLKDLSDLIKEYKQYSKLTLNQQILNNSFEIPKFIEGVINEINPKLTTVEVKYLAIQVTAPLQYIYLKEVGFYEYMGNDDISYYDMIDSVLKNLGL